MTILVDFLVCQIRCISIHLAPQIFRHDFNRLSRSHKSRNIFCSHFKIVSNFHTTNYRFGVTRIQPRKKLFSFLSKILKSTNFTSRKCGTFCGQFSRCCSKVSEMFIYDTTGTRPRTRATEERSKTLSEKFSMTFLRTIP